MQLQRVAAPQGAARASSRRAVVVRASAEGNVAQKVAAAAVGAALLSLGPVEAAKAEISGLTPCSESKAYAKRLKNEVKGLNKRLKGVRGRRGRAGRGRGPICNSSAGPPAARPRPAPTDPATPALYYYFSRSTRPTARPRWPSRPPSSARRSASPTTPRRACCAATTACPT
jgi:hypothetical protein